MPPHAQLKVLRSAVGMTHVLQCRLVMGYTTSLDYTQKLTRSTLAFKLSVALPVYLRVTATESNWEMLPGDATLPPNLIKIASTSLPTVK